jgi:small redox-active disulfide protein 2
VIVNNDSSTRIFIKLNVLNAWRKAMDIKVLGPGCAKCEQTEKLVKEALQESGVEAKVEKVTGTMDIAKYGVFGTPAVVVDGEVKVVGKVPSKEDIKGWLQG